MDSHVPAEVALKLGIDASAINWAGLVSVNIGDLHSILESIVAKLNEQAQAMAQCQQAISTLKDEETEQPDLQAVWEDINELKGQMEAKADKDVLDSDFATKQDLRDAVESLASKAEVDDEVAALQEQIDALDEKKADKGDVHTALGEKADASALASKIDKDVFASVLAKKADKDSTRGSVSRGVALNPDEGGTSGSGDLAALAERVAALEAAIANNEDAQVRDNAGGAAGAGEALEGRVDALEKALSTFAAADPVSIAGLKSDISALEATQGDHDETRKMIEALDGKLERRVAELGGVLASLREGLAGKADADSLALFVKGGGGEGQVDPADLSSIKLLVMELSSSVGDLKATTARNSSKVDEHDSRIESLERAAIQTVSPEEFAKLEQLVKRDHEPRLSRLEAQRTSAADGDNVSSEMRGVDAPRGADRGELDSLRSELLSLINQKAEGSRLEATAGSVTKLTRDLLALQQALKKKADLVETNSTRDLDDAELRRLIDQHTAQLSVMDATKLDRSELEPLQEVVANKADISALSQKANTDYVHSLVNSLKTFLRTELDKLGLAGEDEKLVDILRRLQAAAGTHANLMDLHKVEQSVDELRGFVTNMLEQAPVRDTDGPVAITTRQLPTNNHCLTCDRHIYRLPDVRPLTLPLNQQFPSSPRPRTADTGPHRHWASRQVAQGGGGPGDVGSRAATMEIMRRPMTASWKRGYGDTEGGPRPPPHVPPLPLRPVTVDAESTDREVLGRDGHVYRGRTPRKVRVAPADDEEKEKE